MGIFRQLRNAGRVILEMVNFYCVLVPVWQTNQNRAATSPKTGGQYFSFSFRRCKRPAPVLEFSQFIQRMAEYKVQFEVFEGPLDLLLYLIKKEEVDIYEVNLTRLATQFIEYIDLMRQFDLEIAGEFLVMA